MDNHIKLTDEQHEEIKREVSKARAIVARWMSGVPMTDVDIWGAAVAEGWKPETESSVRDAVAFLTKNGHRIYELPAI